MGMGPTKPPVRATTGHDTFAFWVGGEEAQTVVTQA